jgi:hypothetical protein
MSYVTEADPEMADDPLLEQMAALLETARREGYERG